MLKYNKKKIKEVMKAKDLTGADIKRQISISNGQQTKRLVEGGDVYVSRLIDFCNAYDIPIQQFFLVENEEVEGSVPTEEKNISSQILQKEREIFELKLYHQKELSAFKEAHSKEIFELASALKEKEFERLGEQRLKDWEKFEDKICDKEKEIARWKNLFTELQLKYKELEMSVSTNISKEKKQSLLHEKKTLPYQKK